MNFKVYSRPNCHLCDDMCGRLDQLKQKYQFSYTVVDVDSDIEYKKKYGLLIPVLVRIHDDQTEEMLCHYHLDEVLFGSIFDQ